MELFQAQDHYILQSGERALWCSRRDGGLQLRAGWRSGSAKRINHLTKYLMFS